MTMKITIYIILLFALTDANYMFYLNLDLGYTQKHFLYHVTLVNKI